MPALTTLVLRTVDDILNSIEDLAPATQPGCQDNPGEKT
jgi:hypothetical protein